MKEIRLLRPSDIELRVADKTADGKVHMLMYITSRSATKLLDETYGMENYNIEYADVAGQIYCKLSVWDEEKGRYIIRMDTGEEAKIAADKSLASDALKRCLVRLGVVELYTGPSIYLEDDGYGNRGYKVQSITYNEHREITSLVIANRWGKEVFSWSTNTNVQPTPITAQNSPKTANNAEILKNYCSEIKEQVADKQELKKFYEFYFPKMENWTNAVNPSVLWSKWLARIN